MATDPDEHPDPKVRWYHRRIMAYSALAGIVAFGVAALVLAVSGFAERLATVEAILITVIVSLVGVVGAYMGGTIWSNLKLGK